MRKGVPPIDAARIRRLFGQEPAPGDEQPICLECEVLGHICRRCRAERYHAREAAIAATNRPGLLVRLLAWWRSTTLYRMGRDYPTATPFVFVAGVWVGAFAVCASAWLMVHT